MTTGSALTTILLFLARLCYLGLRARPFRRRRRRISAKTDAPQVRRSRQTCK